MSREEDEDGMTVIRDVSGGRTTGRDARFTGAIIGLLIICGALLSWRLLV
jgi:hypothetical protein